MCPYHAFFHLFRFQMGRRSLSLANVELTVPARFEIRYEGERSAARARILSNQMQ